MTNVGNHSCGDCKVASDLEDAISQPFTLSSGSYKLSGLSSTMSPELSSTLTAKPWGGSIQHCSSSLSLYLTTKMHDDFLKYDFIFSFCGQPRGLTGACIVLGAFETFLISHRD